MFDHTTPASDDPKLPEFKTLAMKKLIQLRIIDDVGCEKFAEYVFDYINNIVQKETNNRVRVLKVEVLKVEQKILQFISQLLVQKFSMKIIITKKLIIN